MKDSFLTHNKMIYVLVLGVAFMLTPFAIDMYLPAFPVIAIDLRANIDEMETSIAIFLIAISIGQLVLGPISDSVGRRPVLLVGLTVFAFASIMIAKSETLNSFYAWRILQAIGAAGGVGVIPMVQARFGGEEGAKIVSYIMATMIVGAVVAPLLGGFIISLFSWNVIFMVLAGISVTSFAAVAIIIREEGLKRDRISLMQIKTNYITIVTNRQILLSLLTGAFSIAGLFAFVAGSPFVYISHFGVAPEYYGFLMGLNALAMIVANVINAELVSKSLFVTKIFVGTCILAVSGLSIFVVAILGAGLVLHIIPIVIFAGALEFVATNSIMSAMSQKPEINGTVSAMNGALGFALGAAASAAVGIMPSVDAVPMALFMGISAFFAFFSATGLRYSTSKRANDKIFSQ